MNDFVQAICLPVVSAIDQWCVNDESGNANLNHPGNIFIASWHFESVLRITHEYAERVNDWSLRKKTENVFITW